jgi:spore coat polysaccharide biosynthesis protein SpsF
MTLKALETAACEAAEAREREHVTPYLREHPERFRQGSIDSPFDHSQQRWTVDHPGDLTFVRFMLEAAGVAEPAAFDRFDLLRTLERHPSLLKIDRQQAGDALPAMS